MPHVYYLSTGLVTLVALGSAFSKLTANPMIIEGFQHLGYPEYLMTFLGVAYVLGVIGLWQRSALWVREWAYAGFFFAFLGAIYSYISVGDPLTGYLPALVVLAALLISHHSRTRLS